jgi:homocitrate synthase NifV
MRRARSVSLADTTLRDGLQAPGIDFTREQKIEVARGIDRIGVGELELGMPAMGEGVRSDIRAIVRAGISARTSVFCRARQDDIEAAFSCGTDGANISFPVSDILLSSFRKDRSWLDENLNTLIPMARSRFPWVSVGAQDATRTEPDRLLAFARKAASLGIDRLRLSDTVGIGRPGRVSALICRLKAYLPETSLEFHAHNDLGMATANAVSALEAGCDAVSVTINGMGERAGNAPLEEVAMAIALADELDCGIRTRKLYRLCRMVSEHAKRAIPPAKPITGGAVFSHESGTHCAALSRFPLSYQPFLPEMAGRKNFQMVFGAHSGTVGLLEVLRKRRIELDENKAPAFLEILQAEARKRDRPILDNELKTIYTEYLQNQ